MNDRFLKQINIDWEKIECGNYLREISSLNSVDTVSFDSNITFFVGENGTGKSTLLEGIAVAYGFNPEGGNKNYNFSTYDSHSGLHDAISLVRGVKRPKSSYFLRAESFYNVASKAEDYRGGDSIEAFYERYGGKSLHQQSHGESFLALIQGNFNEQGFYILDEPEAALSPQRQLTLLIEMDRLAKKGAQFIVASHSPILLGIPDAILLSFDNGKIHPCQYVDTESYQVMEMFINNREYFLSHLLSKDYIN
ncbi:AAA family ATPase [Anaerosacchariphilus polymeriproducens]|uniref:ATP-binding cassette domain-containing protein n=1 Tax=Anaerosacchariphilus polymeriproducens TaxID=1812858 RepID=A0A371AZ28_9FIRM|nr:AAA family ATPase [Anaerosacchariphilus polymeriproducens]RDU24806.1 ATP-binding cassette domain-containing protein [Anaerosacchariphilus polymeriproducens]